MASDFLLAYLATPIPGTWHRRDTLLSLFWPEFDTSHARTSLRNALYVLRQGMGDGVLLGRGDEEISINPAALETDLAGLIRAIAENQPDEALAAYTGELLPGLYPSDSEGFQRWLEGERSRLRTEVARAGGRHLARLEREGRLEEARGTAQRVLEIQPDDEPTLRRAMELHAALGDRAGALAAFEEFRSRLAREFEAAPAGETLALADRLRRPADARPTSSGGELVELPAADPDPLPASGPTGPPRRRGSDLPRRRTLGPLALIALIAIVVAAWWLSRPTAVDSIGKSRPVTAEEGLQIEPAISPSGRLLAYAQGNPQRMRILIRRIDGGEPWPLTGDSNSVELLPRWSPDNDQLVFLARNNAYVAPAVGGRPRLVASGGEGEGMVRSASWSPNGDSIVIVRGDSLLVRPLEGPGTRFIGRGVQLHSCAWSPDGKWIACVSGNWIAFVPGTLFGNQAPSGIVLFPASGGEAVPLTDREHAHLNPAWSADGRSLWILANLDGLWWEVYAARIGANGHPAGRLQRMGLQAEGISLSRDRIAYSAYTRRANIWSLPIRAMETSRVGDAVPITTGNQIVEVVRTSPDRQWLIYDSDARGNADIHRVRATGGAPERLTDDPRQEYAGDLSPDRRELVYQLWTGGQRRLFVRNLESGVATEIQVYPGDQGVPRWAPDGNALVGWEHGSEPGAVFVLQRDSTGNWSGPRWRLPGAQLPVWSPDGTRIAYVTADGSIEIIPADSGAARRIYSPRPGTNDPIATLVIWDGGRTDIWLLGHDSAGHGGLWAAPLTGGSPRLLVDLQDAAGRVNGPTFASDGLRFYFTLEERLSNIRVAELTRH